MTDLDSELQSRDIPLLDQGPYSQSHVFSSSHELDRKGVWALENWCFLIVVLEKTLESPLDCTEIKRGNPKGNQPWIFLGRTVAELETTVFWPPNAKSQLIGKDPDIEKAWRQKWKEWDRMTLLEIITDSMDTTLIKFWEIVEDRGDWCATVHGVIKSRTWLSYWTTTIFRIWYYLKFQTSTGGLESYPLWTRWVTGQNSEVFKVIPHFHKPGCKNVWSNEVAWENCHNQQFPGTSWLDELEAFCFLSRISIHMYQH